MANAVENSSRQVTNTELRGFLSRINRPSYASHSSYNNISLKPITHSHTHSVMYTCNVLIYHYRVLHMHSESLVTTRTTITFSLKKIPHYIQLAAKSVHQIGICVFSQASNVVQNFSYSRMVDTIFPTRTAAATHVLTYDNNHKSIFTVTFGQIILTHATNKIDSRSLLSFNNHDVQMMSVEMSVVCGQANLRTT
jgi:hypothetical protein